MKIQSKPFAALATRFNSDEFFKTRLQLTFLYTAILAVVLALFSGLLVFQVEGQFSRALDNEIVGIGIGHDEAKDLARGFVTGEVTDIETEILGGVPVYVVEILTTAGAEEDVYINRINGNVLGIGDEVEQSEKFRDIFLEEFFDLIVLVNSLLLMVSAFLGYYLAGRTLEPIQNKLRQQEQFSNNVAHELRTPLAALLATAEATSYKEPSLNSYQSAISDITEETKRLIAMTEHLLETAKAASAPQFTQASLKNVLAEVNKQLVLFAKDKQVQLDFGTDDDVVVRGDLTMLERLFSNLVHNAIKFSQPDSTVSIRLNANKKQVSVIDNGSGITKEKIKHIFERFYTADVARARGARHGTGLGLAIVKQIADSHKAKVTVESEEGKGTSVHVTFLH